MSEDQNNVKIVVLQRGWVVVGRKSQEGPICTLDNASVIRRWGTTDGLGEIALGGPTSATVLDFAGKVRYHELTSVMEIDADASKWERSL